MFTFAGQTVSALEAGAFAAGLLSVWLARRMNVLNWPAGIVSALCFAFVFQDAGLYANAMLQLAFVAVGIYGWWHWVRDRSASEQLPVLGMHLPEAVAALAFAATATVLAALFLIHRTDSAAPWPDAAILAFSLVAIWAQARRRVECWPLWIAIDLVAAPLYWRRGLPLTAGLYVLFLLMATAGWRSWRRRLLAPLRDV